MMFFTIMLLFNLTRHIKKHYQLSTTHSIAFPENKYLLNKNITGNDERNEKNMSTTAELVKLVLLYNKKRILDILQNEKISTNTKLDIINTNFDNYNIKQSNLKAGGLMKDSGFDF